jgi:N-acetylglucosaminyldiphosphoundecaprenol N-acetyl-beta-D-mannosaminyltransferase
MRRALIVLGVPIDHLNMPETLDRIERFVAVGRATGKCHQVATVNADFVVNALRDPELRRILQEADLATADGAPLVWSARALGVPLAGRVAGADLVPALAERAAEHGYSIYLLGGQADVATRAAEALQRRYPGLKIAGAVSPPKCSILEMDSALLDAVQRARPDILLVAFGNPKQEKWISMHKHILAVPVCIGVGGTLDIISGTLRRAPLWMQQVGLEWLFRLLQEPRRLWKRYAHDLVYFGSSFVRQWWAMRSADSDVTAPSVSETPVGEQTVVIAIHGRLDVSMQAEFLAQAEQSLAQHPFLVVDLSQASFLDSSAIGALVTLTNEARAAGGNVRLAAVPPTITKVLALVRLDRFFEIDADVATALAQCPPPAEPATEVSREYVGWSVEKMPRLLDAVTAVDVGERCAQRLARNPRLILDFSETIFLSSAGLAVIARLNHQSRASDGELRVAGCSHEVLHGIRLVKLDAVVPLFQDVHSAASNVVESDGRRPSFSYSEATRNAGHSPSH